MIINGEPLEKNQKDYALIIGYIKDNPGATVMGVISATGATLQSINCFLEEGSISYVADKVSGESAFDLWDERVEVKTAKFHGRMRTRR